jgi:hypothetical protein
MGWQRTLHCRLMGTFERFTTKTHFNKLKRLVALVSLSVLAVKLAITVLWAAPAGSPLDLAARLAASVADLGAVLVVWLGLGWRTVAVECRRQRASDVGPNPSRRFASLPK